MRWGKKAKPDEFDPSLIAEVEHFLQGNHLETVYQSDREIPAWVWVNVLAHGDEATLAMAETWQRDHKGMRPEFDACRRVLEPPTKRVGRIIPTVGSPLPHLQREVLIP